MEQWMADPVNVEIIGLGPGAIDPDTSHHTLYLLESRALSKLQLCWVFIMVQWIQPM